MKILLDTHTFLWAISDARELSSAAGNAILDPSNDIYFSAASYWEICIKVSIGKLDLADGWRKTIDKEMNRNAVRWLDIKKEHLQGILSLPMIHRDPFDRLLISQCKYERLRILTSDPNFGKYGLKPVW